MDSIIEMNMAIASLITSQETINRMLCNISMSPFPPLFLPLLQSVVRNTENITRILYQTIDRYNFTPSHVCQFNGPTDQMRQSCEMLEFSILQWNYQALQVLLSIVSENQKWNRYPEVMLTIAENAHCILRLQLHPSWVGYPSQHRSKEYLILQIQSQSTLKRLLHKIKRISPYPDDLINIINKIRMTFEYNTRILQLPRAYTRNKISQRIPVTSNTTTTRTTLKIKVHAVPSNVWLSSQIPNLKNILHRSKKS
ncbi:hypothetical protein J2Z69_000911 [Paenibacillus shirakamiensis]|uniref:Uncharacterized protein n=1 Tax=Paenibacillus shirakamiensis TaxID=1265935 RepID=A0ABS4JDT9_9BACL|nr:hypothetical protein [Paenibacillus shirakamiensis]